MISSKTKPKKKTVKKRQPITDKEQSERFKETARELGDDESGEHFEKAVSAVLKKRDK
jgi:hypothetical protein